MANIRGYHADNVMYETFNTCQHAIDPGPDGVLLLPKTRGDILANSKTLFVQGATEQPWAPGIVMVYFDSKGPRRASNLSLQFYADGVEFGRRTRLVDFEVGRSCFLQTFYSRQIAAFPEGSPPAVRELSAELLQGECDPQCVITQIKLVVLKHGSATLNKLKRDMFLG